MTRSSMKRETETRVRAAIAEDRVLEYLHKNHRENATAIALRVLYTLGLRWKVEQEERLLRRDPRKVFGISDEYVRRVHNKFATLSPASQSENLAEHYIISVLAEFDPDRAWLTSHKVYNGLAWRTGHTFYL